MAVIRELLHNVRFFTGSFAVSIYTPYGERTRTYMRSIGGRWKEGRWRLDNTLQLGQGHELWAAMEADREEREEKERAERPAPPPPAPEPVAPRPKRGPTDGPTMSLRGRK